MRIRSFLPYIFLALCVFVATASFAMAEEVVGNSVPTAPSTPFVSVEGPLFETSPSSANGTKASLSEQKAISETISSQKRNGSRTFTSTPNSVSLKADDGTEVKLDLFEKRENPVKWTSDEKKFYQDPSKEDLDVPLTVRLQKEIETDDGLFIPQIRGTHTSTFDKEKIKSIGGTTDMLKDGKNELGVGVEWKRKDRIGLQFNYDQEVTPANGDSPSQSVGGKIKIEF